MLNNRNRLKNKKLLLKNKPTHLHLKNQQNKLEIFLLISNMINKNKPHKLKQKTKMNLTEMNYLINKPQKTLKIFSITYQIKVNNWDKINRCYSKIKKIK